MTHDSDSSEQQLLSWWQMIVRTWDRVNDHELLTRASAIAFSGMLAAIPFLALMLTIGVYLLPDLKDPSGEPGIGNLTVTELEATLRAIFPDQVYQVISEQIVRIQSTPPVAVLSISIAVTIWTASGLFAGVMDALNRIYGTVESRPFWKLRIIAIVMTVVLATIMLTCMVSIVAWPWIVSWVGMSGAEAQFASTIKWVVITVMLLFSFALTFRVGPDCDQRRKWLTPGAIFGTVLFIVSTVGFRIYVQNFSHYDQAYGSLGGVMAMMLWFWLCSLSLLLAAEMNLVVEMASGQRTLRRRLAAQRQTTLQAAARYRALPPDQPVRRLDDHPSK
jgi:membrane protein